MTSAGRRTWIALLALVLVDAWVVPGFLHVTWVDGALRGMPIDILEHGARVALVAVGAALVVASGGVDLGIGAVMAISATVAARITIASGSPVLAIAAALAAGGLAGFLNAIFVVRAGMPPIVATLIPMVAGRGVAQLLGRGEILALDVPWAIALGSGACLGVPWGVWVAGGTIALVAAVVRRTPLGAGLAATGSNAAACHVAGVPVGQLKTLAYITCSVLAAVAGLLAAADIRAADAHNVGLFAELDAVVAVVLGGTAITGGRFSLQGAIAGGLFLETLTVTLHALGVRSDVAPLPKALVVLAAALLARPGAIDQLLRRRSA